MSELTHEEVKHHIKIYVRVFVALAILTVVTVAISYLHLPIVPAVILAMVVATVKGTLVACYFMHLISERKLIYAVLIFTAFFFVVLLIYPTIFHY